MTPTPIPSEVGVVGETLAPCPFCSDPMQIKHGTLKHVEQGKCVIGAYAWDDSFVPAWNRRSLETADGVEPVAWRWNWGAGGRWFYDEERPNDQNAKSPYFGKLTTIEPLFGSLASRTPNTEVVADWVLVPRDGLVKIIQDYEGEFDIDAKQFRPDWLRKIMAMTDIDWVKAREELED